MIAADKKPILVMAGGTGGHVFPALAVAEHLRNQGETIIWLGTRLGIEATVVPAANFAIEWLSVQGLRGSSITALILAPFKIARACWQAQKILRRHRPKAVLGMGGFASGPGGLMAWLLNVPLFLHEQNSVMGLTNRLLHRLATRNYFGFAKAASNIPRSEVIGNPVRADLIGLELPEIRFSARNAVRDTSGQNKNLNLLVVGGSLGAASLNRALPEAIALLSKADRPQVKHQCGRKHRDTCEKNYHDNSVGAEVLPFIDDMRTAYEWADLVICRSGALTIAELAAVGIASILIPYPYAADNHQFHNACFLLSVNAASVINEADLTSESLASLLIHFQNNREELIVMSVNARAQATVDATENLAKGILTGAIS
jgi:UDP-N-acetylglucosamine--N-acetylmuramyl-(pentapeptide) pyrophosphoryl-undecaprenol N-acetylglucosamine transferase